MEMKKIENIIMQSDFISQSFVYGDSLQSALVAIIVPDSDFVHKWNHDRHTANTSTTPSTQLQHTESLDQLCKESNLKNDILQDIKHISKQAGLRGFEHVKAVYLEAEPFGIDNNLVTPTFKLKRQQLREYYQKDIDLLYQQLSAIPVKSKL